MRIDDVAMGAFLLALKRGASLRDAARAAGFSLGGFWKVRKRDPAFDAAVEEALELSNAPRFIAPTNGRRLQLRRIRRLRFVEWRRELFLEHFAGTCDVASSAELAGVCESTVYRHRVKDPDFAAAFQEALEQGYARLEAEAVRQRVEAQNRLREGVEATGEIAAEFERVLKLLSRWERRGGGVGPRTIARSRQKSWTFDEAILALEARLRALGVPIREVPREEGE
jgi:hypothetical protein